MAITPVIKCELINADGTIANGSEDYLVTHDLVNGEGTYNIIF